MRILFLAFCACLTLNSCKDGSAVEDLPPVEVPVPEPAVPVSTELAAGEELFPWVDGVNVRERPTTEAKRVARILEGEVLSYTGEKSANNSTFVLRGVAYTEPWRKVTTKDGVTGWIFGGAVKRADEKKGNLPVSETQLAFPYFGTYDLSTWEKLEEEASEEGDAESVVSTYRKDGKTMTIRKTEMGDYGYIQQYTITDPEGLAVLEREFTFSVDPDFLLTETVTNRLEDPVMEYSRTQKMDTHFSQLNARPERALGEWNKREID